MQGLSFKGAVLLLTGKTDKAHHKNQGGSSQGKGKYVAFLLDGIFLPALCSQYRGYINENQGNGDNHYHQGGNSIDTWINTFAHGVHHNA